MLAKFVADNVGGSVEGEVGNEEGGGFFARLGVAVPLRALLAGSGIVFGLVKVDVNGAAVEFAAVFLVLGFFAGGWLDEFDIAESVDEISLRFRGSGALKTYPFERPLCLSQITLTFSISPNCSNSRVSHSSSTL